MRKTAARKKEEGRKRSDAARPERQSAVPDRKPGSGSSAAESAPSSGRWHPSQEWIAAACDGVIDIVAALFGVSGRELRSPGRSTVAVSRVRQIAMYVAHVRLHLSMREVGQGFGRDRTTVLYACHQIEDLREDEEFDAIVARVEQVVHAAFSVWAARSMTAA